MGHALWLERRQSEGEAGVSSEQEWVRVRFGCGVPLVSKYYIYDQYFQKDVYPFRLAEPLVELATSTARSYTSTGTSR
jgi:hypothetical protein